MTNLTLRATNGSPLTNNQVDANFTNLNDSKVEQTAETGSVALPSGNDSERDVNALAGYLRFNSESTSLELYEGTSWGDIFSGDLAAEISGNTTVSQNSAKVTNVTTDLSASTTVDQVTVLSSDGNNAVIGAATALTAGIMTKAIFNEHVANNNKASNAPDATKLPLAGGIMTGTTLYGDGVKIRFGDGTEANPGDLEIYHDGTNSYIKDTGAGDLYIMGSDEIRIQDADSSNYLYAVSTGEVRLYYAGVEKIRTASAGIDVTGGVTAEDLVLDGNSDYTAKTRFKHSNAFYADWGYASDGNKVHLKITDGGVTKSVFSASYTGDISIPSGDLRVNGTVSINGDTQDLIISSDDENLVLIGNRSATGIGLDQAYFRMKSEGTNTVVIDTAGNSYFNGGNVGIGNISPVYPLHVEGSARIQTTGGAASADFDITSGATWRLRSNPTTGTNAYGLDIIYGGAGTDVKLRLDSSGTLGLGVVPEAGWQSYKAIRLGGVGSLWSSTAKAADGHTQVGNNTYRDSIGVDKYIVTDEASKYRQGAGGHHFSVAPSGTADAAISWTTAVTIDNSGNLLIGKTDSGTGNAGIVATASGRLFATVSSDNSVFNRLSSDGSIVDFRKDSTTVGSIGVSGGNNTYISGMATDHAGLTFATQQILPSHQGVINDNLTDLGNTSSRFKDLYLAGDIVVGGTVDGIDVGVDVAANTLKNTNVSTNLSNTPAPTEVTVNSSDGTNTSIVAAGVTNAGVMTTTMYDEHVANNAKVSDVNHNVTTNLTTSHNASTVQINSSDGTNATINAATSTTAGIMSEAIFDQHTANNAKVSDVNHNVTTNLSTTPSPTTISIISSDGTNAVINAANGTNAGVMTTTMFDEHTANNAKTSDINHNVSTNLSTTAAPTTITINSSDGNNATIVAAGVTNAGVMTTSMYDEHVANNAKVSDINHNVTTNLSVSHANSTVRVNSSDGTNATINAASTNASGIMTKAIFDQHTANNAKVSDINHNVTTNLSSSASTTQVTIASSDGTNATLNAATTSNAGIMTKTIFDQHTANNAKNTNVTQTITLTGAITGSGSGSFVTSLATNAVTKQKMADDAVGFDELASVVTLIIYNSAGSALKTLYGAGS